jgi:lysophospholipase L1-like esterase
LRAGRVVVAGAALLLVAGDGANAAARPRVWCVGDSITQRYAPALAARQPGWEVLDLGVGGERSDAGLARLTDRLAASGEKPDVVVVFFGTNDLVAGLLKHEAGYGPVEAASNVAAMVDRVRAAGARVLVGLPVGMPRPRAGDPPPAVAILRALRRGAARLRAILRREHAHETVDLRLSRHELFADVVHPTPAGSAELARRVARAVGRVLRPAAGSRG